jgi:hypothetical protein
MQISIHTIIAVFFVIAIIMLLFPTLFRAKYEAFENPEKIPKTIKIEDIQRK